MIDKKGSASRREAGLGQRVATAAGWMVASRWIDRLIGLASIALLARLLIPADFGVVGYAMLIVGLLELFTGIATDAELIRHQSAERDHFDAAWTMNLIKGIVLGAAMVLLAPAAAAFFREPNVLAVMYAMAALPVIQSLENVGIVEFRKRLEFDREFRFLLVPRLSGTVVTIVLAVAMRSYWALVAGTVVRAVTSVVMSYWMHPFRPRLALARVPDIFRFSRWMLLQNLASGLIERIPALVIGRAFDASSLAFYNIAKEISNLATTEVRAPIRRVLYPGLSQVAADRERMGFILVESSAMLALLTLPVPLGIALVAADIVPLFLGNQWGAAVALLQPLAVAAAIHAISTNSSLAFMATNRSYLTALASGARLLLVVALLAALTPRFGLAGVAYAAAIASTLVVGVEYALSSRLLGIPRRRFVAAVWRPVAASSAMCAAVVLLRSEIPGADTTAGHLGSLACSGIGGATIYVGTIYALWTFAGRPEGAERRLFEWFVQLRQRRRGA